MATPIVDGHSIVMIGAWNIRIFSPEWAAANLADETDVALAVSVANAALPIRLTFRGMHLRVGGERLVLTPVELQDTTLEAMQDTARRILDMLPHTPVTAIDVNFQYLEPQPQGLLVELFRFPDNGAISDFGGRVESAVIRRQIRVGEGEVNLLLTLKEDGSLSIEFNNHSQVADATAARRYLDRPILDLKANSLDALQRIYGLE